MAVWLILLALVLLAGAGYEAMMRRRDRATAPSGHLVDIGGRRLHAVVSGQGGPTVVVIAGAGDSSYTWVHVQRALSRFAKVIAYDRAGMGSSDPGPAPTPAQFVSDLAVLLDRLGVAGPSILVGHSLGGLIARAFAQRYPERVAGLVLVDSTPEAVAGSTAVRAGFAALRGMLIGLRWASPFGLVRMLGDYAKLIPLVPERPQFQVQVSPAEYTQWKASLYRNMAGIAHAEYKALFALAEECHPAAQPSQFGQLPLAVLASPTYGPQWVEWQRELATRSVQGSFWLAPVPGHNLQITSPQAVVAAVQAVRTASTQQLNERQDAR